MCGDRHREVHLVVADSQGDAQVAGLWIDDVGAITGGRTRRFLVGSKRVFRAVRRIGARVIHFHDPELIPVSLLLRILGCTVIYDVHEDLPKQILNKHWIPLLLRRPVALVLGWMEGLAGRCFSGVVAATPHIGRRFPTPRTVVARNFPVLAEFPSPIHDADQDGTFAYVGVIAAIRGAREMVQAAGCLNGAARLHLAGNFSPPEFEEELAQLSGWGNVHCLGWLDREAVAELLAGACAGLVVLHPTASYVESLPVKLFEYMAAGVPVIASDFPIWREIVEEAGCGTLVDPLNPDDIAAAMAWMQDNPTEARAMGARGRAAVETRYNWTQESEALLGLYRALEV